MTSSESNQSATTAAALSHDEKVAMYMKLTKRELVELLIATRTIWSAPLPQPAQHAMKWMGTADERRLLAQLADKDSAH